MLVSLRNRNKLALFSILRSQWLFHINKYFMSTIYNTLTTESVTAFFIVVFINSFMLFALSKLLWTLLNIYLFVHCEEVLTSVTMKLNPVLFTKVLFVGQAKVLWVRVITTYAFWNTYTATSVNFNLSHNFMNECHSFLIEDRVMVAKTCIRITVFQINRVVPFLTLFWRISFSSAFHKSPTYYYFKQEKT